MGATFDDKAQRAEFKKIKGNVKRIWSDREVRTWANKVVATARSLAKVNTGRMRRSISFRVDFNGVTIFVGVDYAIHVEYGTIFITAQPFFNPAIESHQREMERALEKAILRGVKI